MDIFCVTEDGTQIDVEVQIVDKKNMERRTLYYWSQMYLMNLAKGGKYQNLKPSITINILRYTIFPGEPAHSMYSIYNKETSRRLNEDMELHFLEVNKFQKKPVSEMTSVERWLAYFSNKLDINEMEELAMNEAAIQTALDASAVFMQNRQERLNYLNREMAIMDYESDKDAWIDEGILKGQDLERLNSIRNLMETMNLSAQQAMEALKIPVQERDKYTAQI